MLIDALRSQLIVVDLQEKLLPVILDHERLLWIVSREMVVFEWLAEAGTPLFRALSREFLRE